MLYGSQTNGLRTLGTQLLTQDQMDFEQSEGIDRFGFELAAGDFDGSLGDDLVIGVPFETRTVQSQGVVHVVYHDVRLGRLGDRNQLWFQGQRDSLGILKGVAEIGDRFGLALP